MASFFTVKSEIKLYRFISRLNHLLQSCGNAIFSISRVKASGLRLPIENGMRNSGFGASLVPFFSKNLDGLNTSGSSQSCGSMWTTRKFAITTVPLGMKYSSKNVSSAALHGEANQREIEREEGREGSNWWEVLFN